MKITVTKVDIEFGTCGDGDCCPIARAIKRAMHTNQVWVGEASMTIKGKSIFTSRQVWKFIKKFDGHVPVQPFSFNLKIK